MLKQSVRILRDNAVKYTPAGGEVTFKAYAREKDSGDGKVLRQVCIEVGDNGIGIPSEELPRIFDRFYRGSNARADNTGGSGLGLSIAQWIVREHGGTIEAISGSGFGTRMTVVLPRYEGQ
jgi:two-component system sensor histidine kinase BaeS